MTNYSDIKRAPGIFGGKAIHHTLEWGDSLLLACDFGIVVLDLKNGFFRDTWYIGNDGGQLKVTQLELDQEAGMIYAATEEGLLQAKLDDPLRFFFPPEAGPGESSHRNALCGAAQRSADLRARGCRRTERFGLRAPARPTKPAADPIRRTYSRIRARTEGLEVVFQYNAVLYQDDLSIIANVAVNSDDLKDFHLSQFHLTTPTAAIGSRTEG